jgi:aldehyde dehydrogenase (NAD+)
MSEAVGSWVDGRWAAGGTVVDRVNPAKPREAVASVSVADPTLVHTAVAAARRAAESWRRTPAPVRADLLHRVADLILERADDIGLAMAREEGKTLAEAIGEARGSAAQFRYAAGRAMEPDGATASPRDPGTAMLWSRREPLGVVACITPWNFPASIPAWKLSHALAAGNTVVWKPSELTPLTSVHLARCLEDAGTPAGVVNMILGEGADVGKALVTHGDIDGVSFTGSSAVGNIIARSVRGPRVRVQLEMGGSNPAIVLDDADLDLAAAQISQGAFSSSGQKCTATARIIVTGGVFDDLADRLKRHARSWVVGDPVEPTTTLGPVASLGQYRHVMGYLESAPRGTLLTGGPGDHDPDDGFYVAPTIYADVPADAPIATEEIFGPVATLVRAESYEQAVQFANDSQYGLSASIFSRDIDHALRFAEDADVGVIKINKATTGNEIHVPFAGRKDSGSGPPEMGWATWDFYTRWKTCYIGRSVTPGA